MTTDHQLLTQLDIIVLDQINNDSYNLIAVCQELCLSRSQLHRRIKRKTGLSTTQYIRKLKLKKAQELLSKKDYRINQLAIRVEILSPQNFSKYFKKEYGMTPTEYKSQIKISRIVSL